MVKRPFAPVSVLFLIISTSFLLGRNFLEKWGVDSSVLILGNLLLYVVTAVSFAISYKGLNAANPHAFVRSVYGSVMIKFFVFAIAAFIYIQSAKSAVNKSALFTCLGLYLVYTFMEVSALTKLLKSKKNA
ncbi:MAG: hypothetical protein JSS70_09040 [Bacteroidetes bacterium]|nr:hypothetical protein [Bacteroidota bacterium]